MRCETFWDGLTFVVRVSGERRRRPLYEVLASIAVAGLVQCFRINRWIRIGAVCLSGSYAVVKVLEVQYGASEMRINDTSVAFVTRMLGWSNSRVFPRQDIEKLGYLRGSEDELPVLGVMIRTLMMPLRFGPGISPEEAEAVLTAVSESTCWIAPKTLRVETPLY